MKEFEFYKYQGAGNDFVMLDNRLGEFSDHLDAETVKKLCDRRFGVGGDGLMALQLRRGYDFEMIYYNADGRPGTMCGNGGRCIVSFANHLGLINEETNFLAVDGPHYAKISAADNWVRLRMNDVSQVSRDGLAYVLNTGSPHYVLQVQGLEQKDVFSEGKAIRNNSTYKTEGINVNFVEDNGDHYFVRTFERGVEDETYACGTGVTAAAMAMALAKEQIGSIVTSIRAMGGDLKVSFNHDGHIFRDVFLEGPAKQVFRGMLNL